MTETRARHAILSTLDRFAIVAALFSTLSLVAFPIGVAPAWQSMLADLGGEMPVITGLVLCPFFTPLLAVVPIILLAISWTGRLRYPIGVRRGLVAAAFAWATAAVAFTLMAMYQPVFQMADAIRP